MYKLNIKWGNRMMRISKKTLEQIFICSLVPYLCLIYLSILSSVSVYDDVINSTINFEFYNFYAHSPFTIFLQIFASEIIAGQGLSLLLKLSAVYQVIFVILVISGTQKLNKHKAIFQVSLLIGFLIILFLSARSFSGDYFSDAGLEVSFYLILFKRNWAEVDWVDLRQYFSVPYLILYLIFIACLIYPALYLLKFKGLLQTEELMQEKSRTKNKRLFILSFIPYALLAAYTAHIMNLGFSLSRSLLIGIVDFCLVIPILPMALVYQIVYLILFLERANKKYDS